MKNYSDGLIQRFLNDASSINDTNPAYRWDILLKHVLLERPCKTPEELIHLMPGKGNEHGGYISIFGRLGKNATGCTVLGIPTPEIASVWQ